MKELKAISETSYLTATNAPQYRRIMRIFYQENEKMRFQLYKEDVLELLQAHPGFEDYTLEQLKLDLAALVEWKNLTPIQDPQRVYTIEDYKNKQFRYSMSEYAVEIERMTLTLENIFLAGGGSPSSNLFSRILHALEETGEQPHRSLKEVNEWWRNLQEDFKRLNQNYQDYLREFYAGKADKVMKSLEFIVHKDLFITYLKEFIRELQDNSVRIERVLMDISEMVETQVLELVIQSELAIPHPISQQQESLETYIRENVQGRWQALKHWFLPHPERNSESSRVLDITNDIIRKIIQNAALIIQLQNWGISRKEDYRKFIKLFQDCSDLKEAHRLSAHLFGIQEVRHFRVNNDRSTDSINSSTYDEEPMIYLLKPHTRNYKPKLDKTGFDNRELEKLIEKNRFLAQMEEERKMVMGYVQNGLLDLGKIDEVVPSAMRSILLRWISVANISPSLTGRTEYGQEFQLTRGETDTLLKCEDGELSLPAYQFLFTEDDDE